MQLQTSTLHRVEPAKTLKLDPKKVRWTNFVYELSRLRGLDPTVADYDTALARWYDVESAYRALREAHTGKRSRRRTTSHDPSLEPWLVARDKFLDHFWGPKIEGKRHGSADPQIAQVMGLYQEAWGYWRKKTSSYAKSKRRENTRRNQLEKVKAKKAAWAKSPEGKAWWASYRAEAKRKRAEHAAAKLAVKDV